MGLYVSNWPISVLGDWKDISIAHVIIIIKSEVSTFPIVIIFFRGWDVCLVIFCHLLYIRSGKTGNLFSLSLCSLWWVQIFGYVLASKSHSFVSTVHHLIIIIVQTYLKPFNLQNACQIYFVAYVSTIKHILSVIHYTICGAVCSQFTHFSCGDWENIYTLSYYHHQIGSMNYYPLFRVRSWNNGLRCMSFYILLLYNFMTRPFDRRQFDTDPTQRSHVISNHRQFCCSFFNNLGILKN